MKTFKDLRVWQKSHQLTLEIYKITDNFPTEEKFSLISQLRRASVSVTSNLVEGFKRQTIKDKLHFYNMAEGSLEELKYQIVLSHDLHFINQEAFNNVYSIAEEVGKLLYRWVESQKN